MPAVGDRVTLVYTKEFVGEGPFPLRKTGAVTHLHASGCFTVSTRPNQQSLYVDPENYATHGCSFRPWVFKDGWQTPRVSDADVRRQEKLKLKAKARVR